MDVESYDGESEMLDLEDSNYGTVSQYPSGYGPMDSVNNSPRPSGALALMPPNTPSAEFQNLEQAALTVGPTAGTATGTMMIPAFPSHQNAATSQAAIENAVHQRVMEVVLAATSKQTGSSHRKRMLDRGSSVSTE
jgi:hypothetical protein